MCTRGLCCVTAALSPQACASACPLLLATASSSCMCAVASAPAASGEGGLTSGAHGVVAAPENQAREAEWSSGREAGAKEHSRSWEWLARATPWTSGFPSVLGPCSTCSWSPQMSLDEDVRASSKCQVQGGGRYLLGRGHREETVFTRKRR